jgi:chaperonin GroES
MSMRLRPLQDRVLVRRAEPETKTAGGILIPDAVQEKPLEGEIVAVGPGARRKDGELLPMDVEAGDRVLFNKWSGTAIKLKGEELMIMAQGEIIGVFDRIVADVKAA